jgi:hypothetical protein
VRRRSPNKMCRRGDTRHGNEERKRCESEKGEDEVHGSSVGDLAVHGMRESLVKLGGGSEYIRNGVMVFLSRAGPDSILPPR